MFQVDDDGTLTAYSGDETEIVIPSSVKTIAQSAFHGNAKIKSVEIPDSVEAIENTAFENCTALEYVHIPKSIWRLESWTFRGCTHLKKVDLEENLTLIGMETFYECEALESIHIPKTVELILQYAFAKCRSLKSINIPHLVDTISVRTFAFCSQLESITFEREKDSFLDEETLALECIQDDAFLNCSALKSITIPENVNEIGENAFFGCTSLASVQLENQSGEISWSSFQGTPWIKNLSEKFVIFENGLLWKYRGSDEEIVIPPEVKKIGKNAFENARYLESVKIPETVECVCANAFENCESLEVVEVQFSKTDVHPQAFSECYELKKIIIPEKQEPLDVLFESDASELKIYNGRESVPFPIGSQYYEDVQQICQMFSTKNFAAPELEEDIKYPLILKYFWETNDADAEKFMQENFSSLCGYVMEKGDEENFKKSMDWGKGITPQNIDELIQKALQIENLEYRLHLMNYQKEHFENSKDSYRLN